MHICGNSFTSLGVLADASFALTGAEHYLCSCPIQLFLLLYRRFPIACPLVLSTMRVNVINSATGSCKMQPVDVGGSFNYSETYAVCFARSTEFMKVIHQKSVPEGLQWYECYELKIGLAPCDWTAVIDKNKIKEEISVKRIHGTKLKPLIQARSARGASGSRASSTPASTGSSPASSRPSSAASSRAAGSRASGSRTGSIDHEVHTLGSPSSRAASSSATASNRSAWQQTQGYSLSGVVRPASAGVQASVHSASAAPSVPASMASAPAMSASASSAAPAAGSPITTGHLTQNFSGAHHNQSAVYGTNNGGMHSYAAGVRAPASAPGQPDALMQRQHGFLVGSDMLSDATRGVAALQFHEPNTDGDNDALAANLEDPWLEAILGAKDTRKWAVTNKLISNVMDAVARIRMTLEDGTQITGTGFLVAPHLLLTNKHIFKTVGASGVADFFYLQDGAMQNVVTCNLRPDKFYQSDIALDYALVYIERVGAVVNVPHLPLYSDPNYCNAVILQRALYIIQHGEGQPQQVAEHVATAPNDVLLHTKPGGGPPVYMRYRIDTLGGASGSPVFNCLMFVVALHHMGIARRNPQTNKIILKDNRQLTEKEIFDQKIGKHMIAHDYNQGVLISAICADLYDKATELAPDTEEYKWLYELHAQDKLIKPRLCVPTVAAPDASDVDMAES